VLVLALSPALAAGPATLVAAVARLLATIADLVWATVGMALRPRRTAVAATDPDSCDPRSSTPPDPDDRASTGSRYGASPL
jgi:hypothetical protein